MAASFWAPLTAFAAALLAVWWLAKDRLAPRLLDHPNPRSLHEAPMTGRAGSEQRAPDRACPLPATRRGLYAHFESKEELHRPARTELAPEAQ